MSKLSKLIGAVTGMLGMKAPKINVPEAAVPAAPAPVARTDAGANIVLGTDTGRTSGSGTGVKKKLDPLGSLGLGGLSI